MREPGAQAEEETEQSQLLDLEEVLADQRWMEGAERGGWAVSSLRLEPDWDGVQWVSY